MKEITVYDTSGNSITDLVQWDTDVVVCIKEEEITKPCKVHFFNSESDAAYAVQGVYENGKLKAKIPNVLLWQPYTIIGYVHVEENSEGKSIYRFRINMRKKPQPTNYVYSGTKDYIEITAVLEECKAESNKSRNSAINSQSWAVGGTGTRTGEDTNNSKYYSQQSKSSANTASTKASEAAASSSAAKTSETKAKTSETNAKASETAAKASETNAASSKTAAANSASAAANSASTASTKATEASNSASTASTKATEAAGSASAAKTSETNAKTSETNAASSKTAAKTSETNAASSASTASAKATEAASSATQSKSYAKGGTGTRTNENIDNAKYYYEQSKSLAESFSGVLRPMGTVAFANLPALSAASEGDMYNISNQFTTTADFKEGAGNVIPTGANVYKTTDGKWDVLAGTPVTGVKGNAESSYRKGNVNITPENIGAATNNHTHSAATQSANGLLSAHDKTWIDGKLCRRYVYGFDTNDTTHNGYYKICSISTSAANMTYSIRLRISSDNFVNFLVPTIDVTIKFITKNAKTLPEARVHFNSSITDRWTNLFGLLYAQYNGTPPSSGGTCIIYFVKKAAYQKIVVDVLDETARGSTSSASNYQNVWTFNTSNTFDSNITLTGSQIKEFNALVDNGLIGSDVQPVYINGGGAIPVHGLTSDLVASWLTGNRGTNAAINMIGAGTEYKCLARIRSTNGVFTQGAYGTRYLLNYTGNATINANTNSRDKSATLLDESGNTSFPGTVSANAFNGNASSATTATKLATARNIAIAGDSVGSTTFDGSANKTISVVRRGCIVGYNSINPITNNITWRKFADILLPKSGATYTIIFHVSCMHGDLEAIECGILRARVGTDSNGTVTSSELVWDTITSDLNPTHFVLTKTTSNGQNTVALYVGCTIVDSSYQFSVISEGEHYTHNRGVYWNLYNDVSSTLTSVTVSNIVRQSTVAALKNANVQDNLVEILTGYVVTNTKAIPTTLSYERSHILIKLRGRASNHAVSYGIDECWVRNYRSISGSTTVTLYNGTTYETNITVTPNGAVNLECTKTLGSGYRIEYTLQYYR